MNLEKQKRLEQAGWKIGNAADFLELTPEEEAVVETGLALARLVRETREAKGWTQRQLAEHLGKHQPQVARLETEGRASFEAQFTALFKMGVNPDQIADTIRSISLRTRKEDVALT